MYSARTIFIKTYTNIKKHKKRALGVFLFFAFIAIIFKPQPSPQIDTQRVNYTDITQSVSASGSIASETTVDLSFLTGGKLVYVGGKKGDEVKQYQVIASLDQSSIEKNLKSSLIDYSKQRNTFEQTQDNYSGKKPENAVSDTMKRILQNNQYDLDKAVNSVELQDVARAQSVLTTPIGGIIIKADAQTPGVNITSATTFTIADPFNLVFKVDIDEADIGKIKPFHRMKISLDAYPDQTLYAPISKIDFASHTTSTGGTAYTVEGQLPSNESFTYKIGMNGDVEIITAESKHILVIPQSSVIDNKYVYVKNGEYYKKQTVILGMQNDVDTQVTSGLHENDFIALQPEQVEKVNISRIPFIKKSLIQ